MARVASGLRSAAPAFASEDAPDACAGAARKSLVRLEFFRHFAVLEDAVVPLLLLGAGKSAPWNPAGDLTLLS